MLKNLARDYHVERAVTCRDATASHEQKPLRMRSLRGTDLPFGDISTPRIVTELFKRADTAPAPAAKVQDPEPTRSEVAAQKHNLLRVQMRLVSHDHTTWQPEATESTPPRTVMLDRRRRLLWVT